MKRTTLLFITLFITSVIYGQKKSDNLLQDSSYAIGIISETCNVGKTLPSHCISGNDKELNKRDMVIIRGVYNCVKGYTDDTTRRGIGYSGDTNRFYEIIYDNETYFIDYSNVITDKTYYNQIESMSLEQNAKFRSFAPYMGKVLYNAKLNKLLTFIDAGKAKGLVITDWAISDESEYTQGTSIRIEVLNPTKKIIKYICFTFIGYNAVDDIIIDSKSKSKSITRQGVGPIEPDASASYRFEYVWFTDLVQTAIISQIKVQYMDGTIKIITNPKSIMMNEEFRNLLNSK